jgi:hypothetical protein
LGKSCFLKAKIGTIVFDPRSELTTIEELCFYDGTFEAICLPRSVAALPKSCFRSATVGSLTFEPGCETTIIEETCFARSTIKDLSIPGSIERLGKLCFRKATVSRLSFENPSRLTSLGEKCFEDCSLRSVVLPNSIRDCGAGCFSKANINKLSFEPGAGIKTFGPSSFEGCDIESLTIPPSVTTLGNLCFVKGYIELVAFDSPSGLTVIDAQCFQECQLQFICVPRGVRSLGQGCFQKAQIAACTFEPGSELGRIGGNCFTGCSLTSIEIPGNVTEISGSAFVGSSMQMISVDAHNSKLRIARDFLLDFVDFKLARYFGREARVTVTKEVKVLGRSCFKGTKVHVVVFEQGSNLKRIEESCFTGCRLKSIQIPRSVETLMQQSLGGERTQIDSWSFEGGSRMSHLGQSAFECCQLRYVVVPRAVEVIEKSCFDSCRGLTSLDFERESLLVRIEALAFRGCQLGPVQLPSRVTFIAKNAFDNKVVLGLLAESREFEQWLANRSHTPANFEREAQTAPGPVFVVDGTKFALPIDGDLPFCDVRLVLAQELNLYCNFIVFAGRSGVDNDMTLNDLADFGEFRIKREERPAQLSGWVVDLSGFEQVRALSRKSRLCRHPGTHEEVVVANYERQGEFAREMDCLIRLSHPCVVPLFGSAQRTPEVATHWIAGGSLADAIQGKPTWWNGTAKSIAVTGIVVGVIHVHKAGIVHRNLCPGNVLFDHRHRPRIRGFESSREGPILGEALVVDAQVGVRPYVAPELAVPGGRYTEKVDVFSFALILFELVTGRQGDPSGVMPACVDSAVALLIRRCWAQQPIDRPSFEEVFENLRRQAFCVQRKGCEPDTINKYIDWIARCTRQ